MRHIEFQFPANMKNVEVAQTFTAYLLGNQSFRNEGFCHGPFEERQGFWQLDGTNDFWLRIEENATISCRYEREVPVIETMVALFKLRHRC